MIRGLPAWTVIVAVGLTACTAASQEPTRDGTSASAVPSASAAPSASAVPSASAGPDDVLATQAACSPVERPPLQAGEHLIGDREPPVPYNTSPPTSGWHASGAFSISVHAPDDPISEPTQVSVLEVGGVVVTYRDLPDADRTALEEHVASNHAGRVAVTPYDQLQPGQVAFTAWGILQRCDGLDLSALDAFVAAHADEEPDVPGGH